MSAPPATSGVGPTFAGWATASRPKMEPVAAGGLLIGPDSKTTLVVIGPDANAAVDVTGLPGMGVTWPGGRATTVDGEPGMGVT